MAKCGSFRSRTLSTSVYCTKQLPGPDGDVRATSLLSGAAAIPRRFSRQRKYSSRGSAAAVSLMLRADHRRSAIAPIRGQIVCYKHSCHILIIHLIIIVQPYLDVRCVHRLSPHAPLPAKHKAVILRLDPHARILDVHRLPCRVQPVKVPCPILRPDQAVSGLNNSRPNRRARNPQLNDRAGVKLRPKVVPDLLPPNHVTAVCVCNRLRTCHKVHVRVVGGEVVGGQPCLHGRCLAPARRVHLVAAEMHQVLQS